MDRFCKQCGQYLQLKELIIDGDQAVYIRCNDCNTTSKYPDACIQYKSYRSKTKRLDTSHLNKHKKDDITLPKKLTKCVHCHETSMNRYENLYFEGNFYINNICSICHRNWS